jgi:hypothetical protein
VVDHERVFALRIDDEQWRGQRDSAGL